MKYLNLTKGFNPFNVKDCDLIEFESFYFNGGEPHIKIAFDWDYKDDIQITTRLTSMNELMMLAVAVDALYSIGMHENSYLFAPYIPGARQDRRMIEGEPLTIKLIADLINTMEFNKVETFDNHSDVSTALIDCVDNISNHEFVQHCFVDIENNGSDTPLLISPDAGANKKALKLAQYLGHNVVIKCDKIRDVNTGNLTGFEVYTNELNGKDCVIVDDICDGGGTFIGLAKELKKKNAGDIYLIVSHGIFSRPLKELKPYFKKIYTTDSWRSKFSWEQQERDCIDLVKIIPFNEFIS